MRPFRFSLKLIFALIAAVAVACAVLFAVPEYVRLATLFLGVLAMPGPLAVLARFATPVWRAFGLGGLVSYAAWFVLVGIPAGFFAMTQFGQYFAAPLSQYGTGLRGGPSTLTVPTYLLFAGLYAPWILVSVGGSGGICGFLLCSAAPSCPHPENQSVTS